MLVVYLGVLWGAMPFGISPEVPQRFGRAVIRSDDRVERVVVGDWVTVRPDVLVPGVRPK